MTTPPITIVTVAYNSAGILGEMLASCPAGLPVIIVDNASGDRDRLRDITSGHGARLIENPENLGFGVACNIGADQADTEFLLFLNPDARLMPDTLDRLLAAAAAHPKAAAFNPLVTNEAGQPVIKRKSDLIPRTDYLPRGAPAQDTEVAMLHGSALLVRRQAFRQIGGFDPGIFLFYEDDDLAVRLRRNCGTLMIAPAARIEHAGGGSSAGPRLQGEAFKSWHMGYSRLYTMRKHRRPLARTRAVLHAFTRVLSPALIFSKLRRVKRLAFLRGTFAALLQQPCKTARQ